jgi:hypothetical protein
LKKLHRDAASAYAEWFKVEPSTADFLEEHYRYDAACAAALASCSKGNDSTVLDEKEKARLRDQALGWLRADLRLRRKQVESAKPTDRASALKSLRVWQTNSEFAGIREQTALAALPEHERKEWLQLWTDVDGILKRTAASR